MFRIIITISVLVFSVLEVKSQLEPCTNKRNKCGYCIGNKVVIPQKYDMCSAQRNGLVVMYQSYLCELRDSLGNEILPMEYKSIIIYDNIILSKDKENNAMLHKMNGQPFLLAPVKNITKAFDNKFVIYDSRFGIYHAGKNVLQYFDYDTLMNRGSFFIFRKNGKYGILNEDGKEIHEANLNKVDRNVENYIVVRKNDTWLAWFYKDSSYTELSNWQPEPDTKAIFRYSECANRINYKEIDNCSKSKLLGFVYSNIKFPAALRRAHVDITVRVEFTILKDGTTTNYTIKESESPLCSEEAINVCKKLVFDRAATFEGQAVESKYTLPIRFKSEW